MTKFGPELRRRRLAAGMTLDDLAARVHYSKGQLSKVETGRQRPTPELARLCDTALGAHGALSALVPSGPVSTRGLDVPVARSTGPSRPSRRQLMTAGAASALTLGAAPVLTVGTDPALTDVSLLAPSSPASAAMAVDTAAEAYGVGLFQSIEALFGEFRRLGQTAPATAVLPAALRPDPDPAVARSEHRRAHTTGSAPTDLALRRIHWLDGSGERRRRGRVGMDRARRPPC